MTDILALKTLNEWLDYIGQIHTSVIDLGLMRVLPLAQALNLTQFAIPVVTVAGTNGKGSVVKALEQIYLAAGYNVAAYTSPHLLHFNERLCCNGKTLDDEVWIQAFRLIESARASCPLSFFEFTTLAALWICQHGSFDILLLEIGLGGRLDAVNIVQSTVAIVTNVDIDHVDWLGDTREKIGFEKAGIFQKGGKAVCGDPNPPLSLLQVAKQGEVQLFCFEKDYSFTDSRDHWSWSGPNQCYLGLPVPHLKLQNIATAIMATELVGLTLHPLAIAEGIQNAVLPGRYETVELHCKVIFDVAHNPQSAHYLLERFREEPIRGRRIAVVGMLNDKDKRATLLPFIETIDVWYVATLSGPRGAKGIELETLLTENGAHYCYPFESVAQAFRAALENSDHQECILIFGSFHTVAEAKELLAMEYLHASTN